MILVVDMNWKKDSLGYYEFVLPITQVVRELEGYKVKHYLEVGSEDLADCSKVILSGTALKDNVTLRRPEKLSWLRALDKPVLGICAGMQTISLVFDVSLVKSVEIGMTQVFTVNENSLFSTSLEAYSLHNYSVAPSEHFEVLAKSSLCIQAIKHKKKPIYGVLFHPEVRNEEILKRFTQLS